MSTHTAPAAPNPLGAPPVATAGSQRTVFRWGPRLACLTGTASAALGWLGMALVEPDRFSITPNSSAHTIIEVYSDQANTLHTAVSLLAAAAVLALVFVGTVWSTLKPYGESAAIVATAGAATVGLLWLGNAVQLTALGSFAEYSDGDSARMLLTANLETGALFLVPFLAMAFATACASLPRVVRAVGVVVAGGCAIGLLPGFDFGWPALWLAFGWFMLASIALAFAPRRDAM